MFNYLFWALALKDVPPVLRLLVLYMADRGAWLSGDPDLPQGEAAAAIRIAKAADWIGCEVDEVLAQVGPLRDLGLDPVEVRDGNIRFTFPKFPKLPEADAAPLERAETVISIHAYPVDTHRY